MWQEPDWKPSPPAALKAERRRRWRLRLKQRFKGDPAATGAASRADGPTSSPARTPALPGTFSRSSARLLAEGDLVVLELAVCADGYWSDVTRTASVGEPDERQRALLSAVREAQAAAIRVVRPGATGEEVDRAARSILEQRGYGAGFTHNCGHHVGFRYHDRGPVHQRGSRSPCKPG